MEIGADVVFVSEGGWGGVVELGEGAVHLRDMWVEGRGRGVVVTELRGHNPTPPPHTYLLNTSPPISGNAG